MDDTRMRSRRRAIWLAWGAIGGVVVFNLGWLLAGALFIWPAAWSLRQLRCARLRERRRREGRCGACGYSLHGIATARCPECGAPTHSAEPFQNLQSR